MKSHWMKGIGTWAELWMMAESGSRSSLAAMSKQGTSNPLVSPWAATCTNNSTARFHDTASELPCHAPHHTYYWNRLWKFQVHNNWSHNMDLLTFVNNSALAEQASDATYISYTKAATSHAAKAFPFPRRFDTDSSSISRMIKAFFTPYKFQTKSPDTCMNKRTLRSR